MTLPAFLLHRFSCRIRPWLAAILLPGPTDLAFSEAPPWSPTDLSGLEARYEADSIAAADRVGNLVSTWRDAVVALTHDLTASGGARPSYIASAGTESRSSGSTGCAGLSRGAPTPSSAT